MKTTATIPNAFFFAPAITSTTKSWGEKTQRISRPARAVKVPTLNTDDFAATKQEVVCGGILALCFFYTIAAVFAQLSS